MISREIKLRESGILNPTTLRRRTFRRQLSKLVLRSARQPIAHHSAPVSCLDVDKLEGRHLISCDFHGKANIFDLRKTFRIGSGESAGKDYGLGIKPVVKIRACRSALWSCQFYPPDPGLFITGGVDGKVRLWDAGSVEVVETLKVGFPLRQLGLPCPLSGVKSTLIAACGESHEVRLCDVLSGTTVHTLEGHQKGSGVNCLAWSPREPYCLITGGGDSSILKWDIRYPGGHIYSFDMEAGPEGKAITKRGGRRGSSIYGAKRPRAARAHKGEVTRLGFAYDGRRVLSAGTDGRLRMWLERGVNTMVHFENTSNCGKVAQFSVAPMGTVVAYPDRRCVRTFCLETGRIVQTLKGHFDPPLCCVFGGIGHRQVEHEQCYIHIYVYISRIYMYILVYIC
ncbi:hypothetical protein AAMO2058_000053700 [Amorphochlora amoebiformis]